MGILRATDPYDLLAGDMPDGCFSLLGDGRAESCLPARRQKRLPPRTAPAATQFLHSLAGITTAPVGDKKTGYWAGRVAWQPVSWAPQQMGITPKTQPGAAGQVQGSLDTHWLRVDGRVAPLVGCAQIGSHG